MPRTSINSIGTNKVGRMTQISIISSAKPQACPEQPEAQHRPPSRHYDHPNEPYLTILMVTASLLTIATCIAAAIICPRVLYPGACHPPVTAPVRPGPVTPTKGTHEKVTPSPGVSSPTSTDKLLDVNAKNLLLIKQPAKEEDGKLPFAFEDMYNASFVVRSPQGQWIGGHEVAYLSAKQDLIFHNVDTNTKETIMASDDYTKYNPDLYTISPDRDYVLITYELVNELEDPIFFAKHKIYVRGTGQFLSFPNNDNMKDQIVMYAGWTPSGSGLVFVFDNDIYYQKDPNSKPERLTTSGATHKTRNGISFWNWNYYGVRPVPAIWWSPDMTMVAYGEFDSTEVTLSEHPIYNQRVYPTMFRQVYLKAGDAAHFSFSKLHLINMTDLNRGQKTFEPPEEFKDKHHYFADLAWKDKTTCAVVWTDRIQKRGIINICDTHTMMCKKNHDVTVQNGWLVTHPMQFIDDGSHYLTIMPKRLEDGGRYKQVVLVSTEDGSVTYLTEDSKEVYWINAYDSINHLVYYTGTNGLQLGQHVFRVGTSKAEPGLQAAKCLTCDEGADCGYASATFSKTTKYYLLSCQGPEIPYYHLRWTNDTSKSYVVMDNADIKSALATRNLPKTEYHKINIGDGYSGWAEFTMPPNMVKDGTVKYPVLFYPYAGPHGDTQGNYVYKGYPGAGGLWDYHLASTHNVIIVRLNGRGSGGRGDDFLFELYRRLGTVEVTDQIDGAKSIIQKFPYVDADHFSVWGWSYGGFVTAHIMGHPTDVFKCGISVAPVTNFRHYYAAYTERYMDLDTPEDNAKGYDLTDVIRKAENFRNKKFMLNHGTIDDNVHLQNAFELMNALSKHGILFRSQLYVDQNHHIRDHKLNRHLFLSMTDFYIRECLGRSF